MEMQLELIVEALEPRAGEEQALGPAETVGWTEFVVVVVGYQTLLGRDIDSQLGCGFRPGCMSACCFVVVVDGFLEFDTFYKLFLSV